MGICGYCILCNYIILYTLRNCSYKRKYGNNSIIIIENKNSFVYSHLRFKKITFSYESNHFFIIIFINLKRVIYNKFDLFESKYITIKRSNIFKIQYNINQLYYLFFSRFRPIGGGCSRIIARYFVGPTSRDDYDGQKERVEKRPYGHRDKPPRRSFTSYNRFTDIRRSFPISETNKI